MSNKTISIAQENKLFDGIDVSSYQGTIDFNRVKASGIDVVYIKAGEGGQITDPYFKQNYLKASRAGLIFGAYYYVTAKNTSEAKAQANDFFNLIRATSFNARPAMDFEAFSGMEREDINEIGLTFLEELERLTKITPMIYTDASSAETIWSDAFSKYPLWLADYSERDEFPPDITAVSYTHLKLHLIPALLTVLILPHLQSETPVLNQSYGNNFARYRDKNCQSS